MDTSILGNLNTGHEFRNLTLEELEQKLDIVPGDQLSLDGAGQAFWAWGRTPTLIARCRRPSVGRPRARQRVPPSKSLRDSPFRDFTGPSSATKRRWQLVEYLKTL